MDFESEEFKQGVKKAFSQSETSSGAFNIRPDRVQRSASSPESGTIDSFLDFAGDVGSSLAEVPGAVGGALADVGKQFIDDADRITQAALDSIHYGEKQLDAYNERINTMQETEQLIHERYRAGNMSKDEYQQFLNDQADEYQQNNEEVNRLLDETDPAKFVKSSYRYGLTPFAFGKLRGTTQAASAATRMAASGSQTASKFRAGHAAVQAAQRTRANKFVRQVEDFVGKVPSLEGPIQGASRQGTKVGNVVAGMLKKPLMVDLVVEEPFEAYESMRKGEWGRAAITTGLLASGYFKGGPIGLAFAGAGKARRATSKAVFGDTALWDQLTDVGGLKGKPLIQYVRELEDVDPAKYRRSVDTLKSLQDMNLNAADGDATQAAQYIIDHQMSRGRPIHEMNAEELLDDLNKYFDASEEVHRLAKLGALDGIDPQDADNVAVGAFDRPAQRKIIKYLKQADGPIQRSKVLKDLESEGAMWQYNPNLRNFLYESAQREDFAKRINMQRTQKALGLNIKGDTSLPKGYFPIKPSGGAKSGFVPPDEAQQIVSRFAVDGQEPFKVASRPLPGLGAIGRIFRRAGVTPEDTNRQAYTSLKQNIQETIDDLDVKPAQMDSLNENSTEEMVSRLSDYVNSKRELYDIRQLKTREIRSVLGLATKSEARKVAKAIDQAYMKIPLQYRGLGPRVQDFNMRFNPLAAGYSRVQGAARYAYNPFFRTQEMVETEVLGQMKVGGKPVQFKGINAVRRILRLEDEAEMNRIVQTLEDKGVFLGGGFGRESIADVTLGRITANLTETQKVSMAGMLKTVAKKKGVSVDELLEREGESAIDMIRVVAQYPRKSVFNSSLAKTMNMVAFPIRYNLKVATLGAEALGKLPTIEQFAVLRSLADFSDWLDSREGIEWRSEHSEVIGVLNYFSPLDSINNVYKILSGDTDSPRDFGLIGGLPFGIIGTILDDQGIIDMNTPYINPRTGEVMPDYVPQTDMARAQVAVTDLLQSMFSYPGRLVGLPGKGAITREFTGSVLPADLDEFEKIKREEDLTQEQRRRRRVLQEKAAEDNPYDGPKLVPDEDLDLENLSDPIATPEELPEVEPQTEMPQGAPPLDIDSSTGSGGGEDEVFARPPEPPSS